MKVRYDREVDALSIVLSDALVEESDETAPGIVLDYDACGNIVAVEILEASKRTAQPRELEYALVA